MQISHDEWLDVSASFTNEINYDLDHLDFKMRIIDQIIPKKENTFKHKYN